jgi:hypothetical protein
MKSACLIWPLNALLAHDVAVEVQRVFGCLEKNALLIDFLVGW